MLSIRLACLKFLVTSLASASHGKHYESKEAVSGNLQSGWLTGIGSGITASGATLDRWDSGDCVNHIEQNPTKQRETDDNKPARCIKYCRPLKYAGVQGRKCRCTNEKPEISVLSYRCHLRCPGNHKEKCGSDRSEWNIFSTEGKFINIANQKNTSTSFLRLLIKHGLYSSTVYRKQYLLQ